MVWLVTEYLSAGLSDHHLQIRASGGERCTEDTLLLFLSLSWKKILNVVTFYFPKLEKTSKAHLVQLPSSVDANTISYGWKETQPRSPNKWVTGGQVPRSLDSCSTDFFSVSWLIISWKEQLPFPELPFTSRLEHKKPTQALFLYK